MDENMISDEIFRFLEAFNLIVHYFKSQLFDCRGDKMALSPRDMYINLRCEREYIHGFNFSQSELILLE